jgi:hypothetical protein
VSAGSTGGEIVFVYSRGERLYRECIESVKRVCIESGEEERKRGSVQSKSSMRSRSGGLGL